METVRTMIRLTGELDQELLTLGLKVGDEVLATVYKKGSKVAQFNRLKNGHMYECSVWPNNYEIISQ